MLIPIGVAAAISTVPIIVVIALLLSDQSRTSALTFLIGWIGGLFGVAGLFSIGLAATPRTAGAPIGPIFAIAEIVVAAILLALGVAQFTARPRMTAIGRWAAKLNGIRPLPAAGLGVGLNFRPKALLLAAAAGLAIGTPQPGIVTAIIALTIYTAISCTTVAVPIILTLARPAAMRPRLRQTRDWLERNQRIVSGIVVVMVGAVILGDGLTRLA